jgi:hypothetical protein
MGRSRAALAVLATAWLGLTAMAVGGGYERVDPARSVDAVDARSALADVVAAAPAPRLDPWSTRTVPVRVPLALAVVVTVVAAVHRRWTLAAIVTPEDRTAWGARPAAPRGPPA